MAQITFQDVPTALFVKPENNLSISIGGKTLVTINADGTMEFGEDYTPDAAAKVFWDAVLASNPLRK